MTKNEVINTICADMMGELDQTVIGKLKNVLLFRLSDYDLQDKVQLPSTELHNNEYILERFAIDCLAKGLKKSSIKGYLSVIKKFLLDTGKNYGDVTGQDITDYLAYRQYKDNISASFKCTTFRYLSTFYKWAYKKHHMNIDIMLDVDTVKTVQKKKERLSDDEVARCRRTVEGNLFESAFLETMLSLGMRVGEIINLRIDDLNFQERTVRIWGEKTSQERIGVMTPAFIVAAKAYIGNRTDGYFF